MYYMDEIYSIIMIIMDSEKVTTPILYSEVSALSSNDMGCNMNKNSNKDLKIVVEGYAFKRIPNVYKAIGTDFQLDSFEQIEDFSKGGDTSETGI